MAALATIPARQPFGILSDSKIRNLQSIKNRQNALPSLSTSGVKRRAVSPSTSDSENVDPNIGESLSKRKRGLQDDDVSLCKSAKIKTVVTSTPTPSEPRLFTHTPPAVTTHTNVNTTPRLSSNFAKPAATPLSAPYSAPAAAGRSPPRERQKHQLPRRRFVPPSLGTKSPSLSMKAALNGTLAHKKARKAQIQAKVQVRATEVESKPNSWFFEIYEEADEIQDYRMNEWTMTQSSANLEISDDEGKSKGREQNNDEGKSGRGKENIDPNEIFNQLDTTVTAPSAATSAGAVAEQIVTVPKVSRKDAMLDEPRTPLGDLNAADFYGEGLDATSVVLCHDDADHDTAADATDGVEVEQSPAPSEPETPSAARVFLSEARPAALSCLDDHAALAQQAIPEWATRRSSASASAVASPYRRHHHRAFSSSLSSSTSIDAVLEESKSFSSSCSSSASALLLPGGSGDGDIEIWESESAKDENENHEHENDNENNDENDDENEKQHERRASLDAENTAFALQEL